MCRHTIFEMYTDINQCIHAFKVDMRSFGSRVCWSETREAYSTACSVSNPDSLFTHILGSLTVVKSEPLECLAVHLFKSSSSIKGVVRLCGTRGLEPALAVARRGGGLTSILPVVVAGGVGPQSSSGSSLPEGALAALAACSPHPCYFRVDPGRLFSREAWQPVTLGLAEALKQQNKTAILVVEADALSSALPQALLGGPVEAVQAGVSYDSTRAGESRLGEDQAVWGLAMMRRLLEEAGRGQGVASVILAGARLTVAEESTVVIDARAALLSSLLTWAQQCAAEALAEEADKDTTDVVAREETEGITETKATAMKEHGHSSASTVAEAEETRHVDLRKGCVDQNPTAKDEESTVFEGEEIYPPNDVVSRADRAIGLLEQTGRRVRKVLADRRIRSAIADPLGAVFSWLATMAGGGSSEGAECNDSSRKVLMYDTDDEDSFRWLASQVTCRGLSPIQPALVPDVFYVA